MEKLLLKIEASKITSFFSNNFFPFLAAPMRLCYFCTNNVRIRITSDFTTWKDNSTFLQFFTILRAISYVPNSSCQEVNKNWRRNLKRILREQLGQIMGLAPGQKHFLPTDNFVCFHHSDEFPLLYLLQI